MLSRTVSRSSHTSHRLPHHIRVQRALQLLPRQSRRWLQRRRRVFRPGLAPSHTRQEIDGLSISRRETRLLFPDYPAGSSPLVDRYTLLSFSTGAVLEDDFPLSWYHLRPYELLEMYPIGTIAPLQRDVLAEYIQPYFHAKVKILRIIWSHRSGRFEPPAIDGHKAKDKLSKSSGSEKRHKIRTEWKTRWVVINHGLLSLCKDHVTSPPVQQFPLNSLSALRGADALERAFSIITEPRVVCIKFQPRSVSQTGMASPPPSSPSSPILESNVHEPFPSLDPTSDSKEQDVSADACKGDGDWVALDMLDDHAFSSILRILHRQASEPISSSFVPSSSIIAVSQNLISSPVAASFAPYETIPYPEWRINTVENARKAGMGDVGKPMAWVLWAEKGRGESLLGNIHHHRQAFSQEMQYKTCAIAPDIYGTDEENDDDSEMEWEGWVRDLERQSRVKQRSTKAGKSTAHKSHPTGSGSGPLPSPPLSEASPAGSPRVRSPSLSMSQLATNSFGSHPHGPYLNIGNVIQASGGGGYGPTEFPRSPDRIKTTRVSTVTVGTTPSPRRRSTTLSAEATMTTRDERDKGRQDREAVSGHLRTHQHTDY
ncbi:hypothetical protein JVU11DRAFT_4408 [Chiua virens]|nr:hypothetical protein JVU11DRAFT_4408 [Chiua virens]